MPSSSSSSLKHADPDRARAEARRLQRQVRDARKGAVRALRADGRFLADVQRGEQRARDAAYARDMGRVHAVLENERAEERREEREQGRRTRRRARKT
jgi:nucleolar protein 14